MLVKGCSLLRPSLKHLHSEVHLRLLRSEGPGLAGAALSEAQGTPVEAASL